jgi:hypothetical protein
LAVPARTIIFRAFPRFFAKHFSEKWSYLPTSPGNNFPIRHFLPGGPRHAAIVAGPYFPPPHKIDV